MKGFLLLAWEKLIAWCEDVLNEPEERTDPPHVYAKPGTLGSFRHGTRCLYCGARDAQMRPHTDEPCERPYRPNVELP